MSELEIPERALTTAAIQEWPMNIQAAAPIIVAAELRRLAADPQSLFMSSGDIDVLLDRADELDPE